MALVSLPHPPMVIFKRNKMEVVRGRLNEWDVVVQHQDGSRVDLTNCDVYLTAWGERVVDLKHVEYKDPIVDVSTDTGDITITDPTNGEIRITLARTRTEQIEPGIYWYDLWYESDPGSPPVLRREVIEKAEFRVSE